MMVNESKEKATTTTDSDLTYTGVGLPAREEMLSLVAGESDYSFDESRDYTAVGLPAREEMLSLLVEAPKPSSTKAESPADINKSEAEPVTAELKEKALLEQD